MLHVQTADCGVCEWPSLDVELNKRVARLVRYKTGTSALYVVISNREIQK